MNRNKWMRQAHRWLSIAFTVISAAIFIVLGLHQTPPQWAYYIPLLPLALLLVSGLYMFFLPYAAKWHNERDAGAQSGVCKQVSGRAG